MSFQKVLTTVVVLAAIGGAVVVGGTWYTAKQFDVYVQDNISILNNNTNIRASWYNESSSFFSRNGELHISILNSHAKENQHIGHINMDIESLTESQDLLRAQIARNDDKPLEFYFRVNTSLLPFIIRGEMTPDMSQGDLAHAVQLKKLPAAFPLLLKWDFNALTMNLETHLTMDEWHINSETSRLKINPLDFSVTGNVEKNLEFNWGWNGLELQSTAPQGALVAIKPQHISVFWSNTDGYWILKNYNLSWDGLSVSEGVSRSELKGLNMSSKLFEDDAQTGKTLNVRENFSLDSWISDSPTSHLSVQNTSGMFQLLGIDLNGFRAVRKELVQSQPDYNKVVKGLERITKHSLRFEVNQLKTVLNDANVTVNGQLQTTPIELEQLALLQNSPASGLYLLRGNALIELDKKLEKTAPPELQSSIEQWANDGYLKAEQNQYSAKINFDGAALTVNGKEVFRTH